jgi:hypothetical protein
MQAPKRFVGLIPPLILAICLSAVYLASMAPGYTWANVGADGGDLIAAAATGGVAHPTGYPLYLLLARLFQFLPLGSLAFRTNLLSAVATISAAILVYVVVGRSLSTTYPSHNWLAGLAAGFAFGFSPLLWSQAVITEVYALQVFLVALLLFLSIQPVSGPFTQKRLDCFLGLTFGLAMGNHLTTILIFPVVFLSTFPRRPAIASGKRWIDSWQLDLRSLFRRLGWIVIGISVYLTLPLRALSHPPVNWGNPVTLDGFVWLVSGKLYQGLLLGLTFSSILERARTVVALFLTQFGIIGLCTGLVGLIIYFKASRLNFSMLWIAAASAAFAMVYATMDAYMYLIPMFLCFSIWIGMGLGGLMETCSTQLQFRLHSIGPVIGAVFVMILFLQAWKTWPAVNASHDQRAEFFGSEVFSLAPENAIMFAKGDNALFTLWYFQYALGDRPDLAVVSTDLLQFTWYLQALHSTYPDLHLPGPFPFVETVVLANPGRPICYVQYIKVSEINCLPARASH